MGRRFSFLIVFLVSVALPLTLTGCQVSGSAADPPPEIHLPVVPVTREDLQQVVTLPGTVSALPDHSVKTSPAIAGKLVEVHMVPGEHVSRGEVIAELDSRELTAKLNQAEANIREGEQSVYQAQTSLQVAEDAYKRNCELYQEKIAAAKDYVAAKGQWTTAGAQLNAAQEHLNQLRAVRSEIATQLGFTKIYSPISGVVARRFLNVGDTAEPNAPIVQVVDLDTVVIDANLPADLPAEVRVNQRASISSVALPGLLLPATVTSVSPSVDSQSNTLLIRLICHNPETRLKEGQAVSVSIITGVHKSVLTVPKTALVPDPDHLNASMVYVFLPEAGTVKSTKIQTGIESNSKVEVLTGLSDRQSVVASGAYGLPDGTHIAASMETHR